MTISAGPGSEPVDDEAPAVVVVGRTIGGMAVGVVGLLGLIVGGALVQRARKKRFEPFVEVSQA